MPRPERSFRTPAIILKRRDFGEADRLLTVITPRHGKIDVIARGARKLNSQKTGHVELYTRTEMLINTGRELGQAVQSEMVAAYLPLREDLTRGAYAAYAAELLDRFTSRDELSSEGATADEEDSARLFALLDDTLERLSTEEDPRLAVRYFEMRLLDLVGFRPELTDCIIEREPIQPVDQFFSHEDGGVVCPLHAVRCGSVIPVPMVTLKLMRHLQRSPYSHVRSLNVPLALHDDVERVMVSYLTFLLERRLQSVEFLRRLRFAR